MLAGLRGAADARRLRAYGRGARASASAVGEKGALFSLFCLGAAGTRTTIFLLFLAAFSPPPS